MPSNRKSPTGALRESFVRATARCSQRIPQNSVVCWLAVRNRATSDWVGTPNESRLRSQRLALSIFGGVGLSLEHGEKLLWFLVGCDVSRYKGGFRGRSSQRYERIPDFGNKSPHWPTDHRGRSSVKRRKRSGISCCDGESIGSRACGLDSSATWKPSLAISAQFRSVHRNTGLLLIVVVHHLDYLCRFRLRHTRCRAARFPSILSHVVLGGDVCRVRARQTNSGLEVLRSRWPSAPEVPSRPVSYDLLVHRPLSAPIESLASVSD